MKKAERHAILKRIVETQKVNNQEMLVSLLANENVFVTQATISRDINELQLIKNSQSDSSFYYSLPSDDLIYNDQRLSKMLKKSVLTVNLMEKYLAIKTVPGSAVALGILLEDKLQHDLFTNLTTDDKVLLIFQEMTRAKTVYDKLKSQLSR